MNLDLESAVSRLEKILDDDEWYSVEMVGRKSSPAFTVSIWVGELDRLNGEPSVIENGTILPDVIGRSLDRLHECRQSQRWYIEGKCKYCGGEKNNKGLCFNPECRGADDMPF